MLKHIRAVLICFTLLQHLEYCIIQTKIHFCWNLKTLICIWSAFFFKQFIHMNLQLSLFINRNPIFIEGIYITLLILKEIPLFLSLAQMNYSIDHIRHVKLRIINCLKAKYRKSSTNRQETRKLDFFFPRFQLVSLIDSVKKRSNAFKKKKKITKIIPVVGALTFCL